MRSCASVAVPLLFASLLLVACGGWQLGAGKWGPIATDGVYICFGEQPLDPANCSPAKVYVCNSNDTSRTAEVESYFSFGADETRVDTVSVPAGAKVPPGNAPFVGFSEYKRLTGVCSTRQYRIKSAK
jgi:hypothetical protein